VAGRPGTQRDVEQHDVVRPIRGRFQGCVAVRHRRHAMPLALEGAGEHVTQRLVVVDEQDLQRRRRLHGSHGSPPGTG
jgi:hypothetical protein